MNATYPSLLDSGTLAGQASGNINLRTTNFKSGGLRTVACVLRADAVVGALTNFFITAIRYDSRGNVEGAAEFTGSNPSSMAVNATALLEFSIDASALYQVSSGLARIDVYPFMPPAQVMFQASVTVATTIDLYYEIWGA